MYVELGNADVVQVIQDDASGTSARVPVEGQRVTTVNIPDGVSLSEAFVNITDPRGAWAAVSDGTPTFVASDNPQLQALLASHFGCPEGRPADLEATHYTLNGPPGVDGSEAQAAADAAAAQDGQIVSQPADGSATNGQGA